MVDTTERSMPKSKVDRSNIIATRCNLQVVLWRARQDSNLRPSDS
jgi:hypothetical protein